jgi:DNA-binding transcriptional LysR family regulator
MNLDLNALRTFVLVVDAGGVTEAARRAGLPKSTVSRHVRDLESRLGERLLERHGRGVAPTGAGRRLHESARPAVGALERLRHDLLEALVAGRVRIAAPVTLARGPLRDVIGDFLARHPTVDLHVTLSDRFSAAENPDADVAVCVGITPSRRDDWRSVGFVESRLYATPGLIGEHGEPRTSKDLAGLPILAQDCAPGGHSAWTLTDPHGRTHTADFVPHLVASDPDFLLAAALAGCGVCRIATFLAEPHLLSGRLVPVLDGVVAERFEVSLAILRRRRDAAVRRFAAEAAELLGHRLAARP